VSICMMSSADFSGILPRGGGGRHYRGGGQKTAMSNFKQSSTSLVTARARVVRLVSLYIIL
jgi:hypothetical protein